MDPFPGKPRITYGQDGKFKVVVFSDLHFGELLNTIVRTAAAQTSRFPNLKGRQRISHGGRRETPIVLVL
jgi:hypothetical protein